MKTFSKAQQAVFSFSRESVSELKKVSWPSRGQVVFWTLAIFILSAAMAVFTNVTDSVIKFGLVKITGEETPVTAPAPGESSPFSLPSEEVGGQGATDNP